MSIWLVALPQRKKMTPQQDEFQTDCYQQLDRLCGEAWGRFLAHNLSTTELRQWWYDAYLLLAETRDVWERTYGR